MSVQQGKEPLRQQQQKQLYLKAMKYIKRTHYLHLAKALRGRHYGYSTYVNWYILRHFTGKTVEIYNIKEKEVKKNINTNE